MEQLATQKQAMVMELALDSDLLTLIAEGNCEYLLLIS